MISKSDSQSRRLRVVSYNVHSCVGMDGVFAPARIADVLGSLDADFVALQEVEERDYEGKAVSVYLAETLGLKLAGRTTHERHGLDYGNVLLSRSPAIQSTAHDFAFAQREPRGAVEASFEINGQSLLVIASHFGLAMKERHDQLRKLLTIIDERETDFTIVCADFNEWLPFSRMHRRLSKSLNAARAPRTFPSRFPVLALDRIYASSTGAIKGIHTVNTPLARLASDHLPLVADFELGSSVSRSGRQL